MFPPPEKRPPELRLDAVVAVTMVTLGLIGMVIARQSSGWTNEIPLFLSVFDKVNYTMILLGELFLLNSFGHQK